VTAAPALPPRLTACLVAVRARLDPAGVRFLVAGGTARALLGARARPADLDLEVAAADAAGAAALLGLPPPRHRAGGGFASTRAGGRLRGVRIDLSAGVTVDGEGRGRLADAFTANWHTGPRALVAGHEVRLLTLEEQVARLSVAGDEARLTRLRERMAPLVPDTDRVAARLRAAHRITPASHRPARGGL
jgi:hypothetical protein